MNGPALCRRWPSNATVRSRALMLAMAMAITSVLPFASAPDAAAAPLPQEGAADCKQTSPAYVPNAPPGPAAMNIDAAWAYSKGAGVVVAVVDSGVAAGNAHLAGVVLPGADMVAKTDGTTDIAGIGTAIAGLVASQPVGGSGLVGIAPHARILPVRVYEALTTAGRPAGFEPALPSASATARGITWAADHGARVIVVPTVFTDDSDALRQATQHAHDVGALVVAPVGDIPRSGTTGEPDMAPRYPAGYPGVLGVTGVDVSGQPAAGIVQNNTVMLAVPGAGIVATFFALGDCTVTGDAPSSVFASGYAAGLAALVAARFPQETPDQWAYRLMVTAVRPLPAQRDDAVGWGLAAPVPALTFIDDGRALGPPNPVRSAPAAASPSPVPEVTKPDTGLPRKDVIAIAACAALACVTALLAPLLMARGRRRSD